MAAILQTLNFKVYLGVALLLQVFLIAWTWRRTRSIPFMLLNGVLPVAGLPALLYFQRGALRDNHVAGALTYLVLLVTPAVFLFLNLDPEETPWALIYTMQLFSFLGLANLLASPMGREE